MANIEVGLLETEKQLSSMIEASGKTVPQPGERANIVEHLDYIIQLLGTMVSSETFEAAKEKMANGYNAINDRIEIVNWLLASGEISGDVDIEPLTITENGEYTPGAGKAFGRVVVSTPEVPEYDMYANVVSNFSVVTSQYNSLFTYIKVPACTTIGTNAFGGYVNLTSVDFPACTNIGTNAFGGCGALTSVRFPVCTSIGTNAFGGCGALTSVDFPVCTSIGNYAFGGCRSLTSVDFPVCTSIGENAFKDCYNLISIYLLGDSICDLLGSSVFLSTPIGGYSTSAGQYGSIFVPASLVDAYKTATNWSAYSDRITAYVEP